MGQALPIYAGRISYDFLCCVLSMCSEADDRMSINRRLLDELNKDHRGSEFVKRPGSHINLLHPKLEFLKQVS